VAAFYLLTPLLLTFGTAFATYSPIRARGAARGRIGAVLLVAEAVVTSLGVAAVLVWFSRPGDERCQGGYDFSWAVGLVLLLATAALGGPVLAAVVADATARARTRVRDVLGGVAAVALPYVLLVALFFAALTCIR
jgi:hypothetical protein